MLTTGQRYLAISALLFVGLSVITIGVNYLVDPYLVFGSERHQGVNATKVDIGEHVRLSKAYHPTSMHWTALLIGNSRIEMGLDPNHHCFEQTKMDVYNIGIPGAGVRQQMEYALNIMHAQPVREVYLSLDYVDFLIPAGAEPPDRSFVWTKPTGRLRYTFEGSPNPEYRWQKLLDQYRALFSLNALESSIRTVVLQKPGQANRDDNGFNPADDFATPSRL